MLCYPLKFLQIHNYNKYISKSLFIFNRKHFLFIFIFFSKQIWNENIFIILKTADKWGRFLSRIHTPIHKRVLFIYKYFLCINVYSSLYFRILIFMAEI